MCTIGLIGWAHRLAEGSVHTSCQHQRELALARLGCVSARPRCRGHSQETASEPPHAGDISPAPHTLPSTAPAGPTSQFIRLRAGGLTWATVPPGTTELLTEDRGHDHVSLGPVITCCHLGWAVPSSQLWALPAVTLAASPSSQAARGAGQCVTLSASTATPMALTAPLHAAK